ncbi:hypothetical protein SKAU_G00086150 [Synaphobranchus kaupii]|uniref:Microtubule associated scaffold protein 2 n=1 Tax=Synaphobranchus kaupii TaxID=118154 RepID=A0A9Q1FW52_SYNKA|nr:hypothetical protein SKAU_G00086150 [Synaphobranchus kaupii]
MGPHETAGLFRSPRALRPQLGLGAVTRLPSAKSRMLMTGQRSALTFSHPTQMVSPPPQCYQEPSELEKDNRFLMAMTSSPPACFIPPDCNSSRGSGGEGDGADGEIRSEAAVVRERELSLELSRIRDEVAFNVARWERLQRDKEDLERRFERELRRLQEQQEAELGALEERLRARHQTERERLYAQQRAEMEELRTQQQEQMEEMNTNHDAAMVEMENNHSVTISTLQEDHAKTLRDLIMAHEQQRRSLEEDFEKLRLSLQDQVDTLTFQNRSLRDRAKRFEEALRRSTDEQIVDALAPYQHVEEDLKSLKEVLEMKNQQIHEQEIKITELEKMAQKNVVLEERVQVLQQQNEDLKARIDRNLAMSRQLSEENANLQEYVEKESNEKKRLSRNNEELLWRLQTGELSPRMSPSASPIHRASPGPASPSRLHPFPR